MKINLDFVKKVFNRKLDIRKEEDKIKLSKYSKYIPMYDIYSEYIYPISNVKLHYRLKECHYRFVTSEIKQWIINKLNKTKDEKLKKKYIYNLEIINNYNLAELEKTSYETLYKYSPDLGLSISICKRNSFHPYSYHLKPYYSRDELIKLGMNNKLIKKITPENLVDKKLHYDICKTVSKNDISSSQIIDNIKHIIDSKCINWVNFYSLTGSYIYNDFLRNQQKISRNMLDGLTKLNNCIKSAPAFDNDYYLYRFLWEDKFIKNLKIGNIFEDKGFLSTTRDPFYSPGILGDFGLILVKINIPRNKKGIGMMIENLSMFPNEEELLLPTNSRFKLISKDDNFKYYHTNKDFENKIKKKYEFTYIDSKNLSIDKKYISNKIPEIDIDKIDIMGKDRLTLFKIFLEKCDDIGQFKYDNKIFISQFFDSESSYEDFHINKTKNGFIINYYDNGYPILSLEFGEKYIVNFSRTYHYYDNDMKLNDIDNFKDIISYFGRIFKYKNALIYFPYYNFSEFKKNYTNKNDNVLIYTFLYNKPIYDYVKNNKKYYNDSDYKYRYGYYNIDKLKKTKVPENIKKKIPKDVKCKNWAELLIDVIENHYYYYPKLEEYVNNNFDDLFKKAFVDFNITSYLKSKGDYTFDIPTIDHINQVDKGHRFKLIYDSNIKRY